MLRPSYAELMDVLNKDTEGDNVKSRYTVVIAAAKRARQLIDGHEPMIDTEGIGDDKAMSIAVQEIYQGKIEVVPEGQGTVLVLKNPEPEEEDIDISAESDDVDDLGDDFDDAGLDDDFDDEDADMFESLVGDLFKDDDDEDAEE